MVFSLESNSFSATQIKRKNTRRSCKMILVVLYVSYSMIHTVRVILEVNYGSPMVTHHYIQAYTCNEQMIENSLNLLYVLLYKCHKSVKALFHCYQMVETKKKPKELILEL